MKLASRFMPKYEPEEVDKPALTILVGVAITIAIFKPVFLVVVAGIALLMFVWSKLEQPKIEKYFGSLCRDRAGLSICEFAREFDPNVVDTWVIRATYEQLQLALPTSHKVPIKASDNLFDTLKLDEDDLDLDLMEEIAQRTGRSLENFYSNPYYGKVTTARSLVLFFNNQVCVNAT